MRFTRYVLSLLFAGAFACAPLLSYSQMGKDGARTISAANTAVNEYTLLSANTVIGSTTIAVGSSALNANNRFGGPLSPGDLIMIIQLQGATITTADDSTFGNISSYNNCGNYELRQVSSVPSGTSISLTCGLSNPYTAAGKTLIVRVPRYTTLTVNAGASLVCPAWDGTQGGVVAVEAQQGVIINAGSSINATGRGFRGGAMLENLSFYGVLNWRSTTADYGGEKGESIAGYQADYDALGGRYCKGAPANGGGGANAHNAGGGGGANAAALPWTGGRGTPDPNAAYVSAWNLEYTGFATSVSGGGGRGGYSFSSSNQNELTLAPGNTAWGGDYRRINGGLGARPLNYSGGKIFFGGGGGSGDQNDSKGGAGGAGGGIVYITTRGTINGGGTISSDGSPGANSAVPPLFNTSADGAGGGGAGGTILIDASGVVSGINITANAGVGGNQNVSTGNADAYGPGGGGGGGYIAISNGAVARSANGANNGTTNAASVSLFPPNGATRGGAGLPNESISTYSIAVAGDTICQGSTTTLTATVNGNLPSGGVIGWYVSETAQSTIATGNSFTTPPLSTTTTYYVGVCPGFYRIPVTVEVGFITAFFTPPVICTGATGYFAGQGVTTLGTIVSWSWDFGDGSPATTGQNVTHVYTNPGSYLVALTVVDSYGCQAVSPGTVNVQTGPLLNYSLSNTNGCPPLNVSFNNTSVGATGYTWNFGDGSTSTQVSPTHTYTTSGVYSVYLVATNGNCSDTLVTTNVVNVTPRPTSSFTTITTICQGDTSVFANLSSANGGTITSYSWDFGDGSPLSSSTSPRHFYSTPGTYQVRLTASGGSCTDDTIITVTVAPTPVAGFTPSAITGCTPVGIIFNNTTTGPATYTWTFGDGGTSTTASPSHTYTVAGTYTVTLIAQQGACRDTARTTTPISVYTSPRSSFTVADSVCQGVILPFSNSSTGNGSPIVSYSWNFGDGTPISNQISPVHLYTSPGLFQAQLTVSNANCSDDSTISIYVGPTPVVNFTPSITQSCSPVNVSFSNTTTGLPTYTWNFGDGSPTTTLANPTHFYGSNGTYTVTLIAVRDFCSDTNTATITISPQPASSFSTSNVCLGDSVRFVNLSSVSGGTITSTQWDFGDGTPVSSVSNPSHYYVSAGAYQVRLTVSTGSCTDDTVISVTVSPSPIAGFTAAPTTVCSGETVAFSNTTTGSPTYLWSFGDGATSSLTNPSHTYSVPGNYTVTLAATQGSCGDTLSRNNLVSVVARPTGSFTASSVCLGDSMYFSDLSTGAITSYQWDFGDGGSAGINSPAHLYAAAGTYSVRLTVASGVCSDDTTVSVVVSPRPVAAFTPAATTACGPVVVQFNNTTVPASSYSWNFGDGNTSSSASPSHQYTSVGTYTVTLLAQLAGCSDTIITTNAVQVFPYPVSSFSAPSVCLGDSARFTNLSTVIGAGTASYSWDFGDGTFSTAGSPAHYYASAGTYTVRLTSTVGTCTDDTVLNISIGPAPQAQIGATSVSGCAPFTTTFINTTTGSPTYVWNFGDGNSSTSISPSHTYTSQGNYTVTMIATQGSCSDTATLQLSASSSPVAVISAPPAVCLGDTVRFINSSTAGANVWTFGDGSTGTTQAAPSHVYATSGTFVAQLVVSSSGCSDTATTSVTVEPLPSVNFSANTLTGCDSLTVVFTPVVSGATTYTWLFGDGGSSSTSSTSHTYVSPGTYSVSLTATSSAGCITTRGRNNYIVVRPSPVPQFTTPNRTLCRDACIGFSGTSTGSPTSWLWGFQGALPSSSFGPSATPVCYPQPGTYDVTLTVSDGYCTRTITQADYLNVVDCSTLPVASFIVSDSNVCQNSCVDFVSLSLNAISWAWSFPGATPPTSSIESPTNVCYPSSGTYPVTLIVSNPVGSDTLFTSALINVSNVPSVPSFTQTGDTLIAPAGFASYQWFYNNIPISGATGQRYIATLSGNYAVQVIETSGCSSTSANQHVSLVGLEDVATVRFLQVYPNPTSGETRLEFYSDRRQTIRVTLTNAIGQELLRSSVAVIPGTNSILIPLSDFSAGAYWLEVESGWRISRKLIKY